MLLTIILLSQILGEKILFLTHSQHSQHSRTLKKLFKFIGKWVRQPWIILYCLHIVKFKVNLHIKMFVQTLLYKQFLKMTVGQGGAEHGKGGSS